MTQAFDPGCGTAGRVDVRMVRRIPNWRLAFQYFQQTAASFLLAGNIVQPRSNGIVGDCA